jgi:hypothetical protein
MKSRRRATAVIWTSAAAVAIAVLSWLIARGIRERRPYSVDEAALSGWTLVSSAPGDAAVVALQPPAQLSTDLFQQVSARTQSLTPPPRPSVPLVLESEYSESLQGVLGIDDILRVAREAGLEAARFEPICLGQQRESTAGASGRFFFVVFDAPAFDDFRQLLTPLHPEHAGTGDFDPRAVRLVLPVAAADTNVAQRWPTVTAQGVDCLATVNVKE